MRRAKERKKKRDGGRGEDGTVTQILKNRFWENGRLPLLLKPNQIFNCSCGRSSLVRFVESVGTLRSDNTDANENVAEKLTSRPFKLLNHLVN